MAKKQNQKNPDMVRSLIRISNLTKGISMHFILLFYIALFIFTSQRLDNHEFVIFTFIFVVSWYWFARVFERKGRKKGIVRPRILIVENIVETIGLALVLWFFGHSNGPLFFFYAFVLMESCLLLSVKLPWVIAGIGSSITITEFFYLTQLGEIQLNANSLIFLFIRLIFFMALASHFSTLARVNISEREKTRRLEIITRDLQKAYEELKRTDKLKSEFLGMASHQLRTPLTAIKGYLSMVLEGDYGKLADKVKDPLNKVFASSNRLARIVSDLLDISCIDLGKMQLNRTKVHIEDLLQSCYDEMKVRAEQKQLNYLFQPPRTPLPPLTIDESKIRQVILNLLDNGIRYTNQGTVTISTEQKDNHIFIKVQDTGEGLTKEEQRNIFEGFSRGAAGINYYIEGAGLGLYVSRKYLNLHQGRIWAESQGKGKGSTFYIELPIG